MTFKNNCSNIYLATAFVLFILISCSSSQKATEIKLTSSFDESQYVNPQDFGYDLSIKKIEENPPADPSFIPISVKGGMRQAFGKVKYPLKAQQQNISGKVVLQLYINSHGKLTTIMVIESPHTILQEAAVEAAQKWSYNPATLNGTAVASIIQIPINFRSQVQEINTGQ